MEQPGKIGAWWIENTVAIRGFVVSIRIRSRQAMRWAVVLSALLCHGSRANQSRLVPVGEIPDVLDLIARVSQENYDRIQTWQGQVHVVNDTVYEGAEAERVLGERLDKVQAVPAKVLESTESKIEFCLDLRRRLLYSKTCFEKPVRYRDFESGKDLGQAERTGCKVSIFTPEHHLYLDSAVLYGESDPRRVCFREKPPKDCLPCEVPSAFDPRTLYGTPEPAWETFPAMVRHINEKGGYVIAGRALLLEEHIEAGHKRYRLRIPWRSETGEMIFIFKSFDETQAYNPVMVEFTEIEGKLLRRASLDYERIRGSFMPVRTTFQRHGGQEGRAYLEKKARLTNVRINEPIAPDTFSMRNVGLQDDDFVVDHILGKRYRYQDEKLIYLGPERTE